MAADIYTDLPEDKALAFVRLENHYRSDLIAALKTNTAPAQEFARAEYVNNVVAAARELDIPEIKDFKAVNAPTANVTLVSVLVRAHEVQVQIRFARRAKQFSVKLDAATKEKIRITWGRSKRSSTCWRFP
jgi:hypothetical protein